MSAGSILWLIIEVAMARKRKKAPMRLQHKTNIIFSVLLVFIFGVLSCVLKIILSPPFLSLIIPQNRRESKSYNKNAYLFTLYYYLLPSKKSVHLRVRIFCDTLSKSIRITSFFEIDPCFEARG